MCLEPTSQQLFEGVVLDQSAQIVMCVGYRAHHYHYISTTHLAQESSGRSSTPNRTSLSGTLPSSSVERMSLKQERCVWRSLRPA